jgi:hypothetical protein
MNTISQLIDLPEVDSVETLLRSAGYPSLFTNYEIWNFDVWRLENTPRFVWQWRKLRLVLDQLYLVHNASGNIVNIHDIAKGDPRIV